MRRKLNRVLIAALALAGLCAFPSSGLAQSASESRAFNAAVEEFEDGLFPFAENDLAEFVRTFPASVLVSEAILYQGRAAIEQQKFKLAIDLLMTNAASATVLGDQYRYWLADAYLQSSNYSAAQNTFTSLIKQFPDSNLLLEASYGEALTLFRQRDWSRTIALLRDPNGTFRQEARLRSANEFAMRGALLLSEALLEGKQFEPAEQGLERLLEADLTPALKWRRQYLLCRIQESDQRLSQALANTTNLLALATASGERNLLAESIDLQGEVLERLDRLSEATQVYESNLAENVAPERARQALLKIAGLTLAQDKTAEAAAKLETFLIRRPEDAASDVVLLTAGELHLKLHFLGASQTNRSDGATNAFSLATNHLDQALANFERVLTNRPPSSLAGKAVLDKGWCLWAGGKIPESQAAFKAAAEMLPHSQEQALARFKLAEAQFAQKDFTNAMLNFRAVLNGFGDLPRIKEIGRASC